MSKAQDALRVHDTGRAVLRYLRDQPEAKDTLDGIARWWLERERTERLIAEVEQAVDLLLVHDFLLETRRPGTPPSYRLNAQQRELIARMTRTRRWSP